MATLRSVQRWWRSLVGSVWTVPVLVLAFSQWEVWIAGPTHLVGPRWSAAVSLAAGSLLLAGRRRMPLAAQIAAAGATGLPWLWWGSSQIGSSFAIGVLSTYAVGRWGHRPAAYAGVPVAAGWALLQVARDPLQAGVGAGWGWALYAAVSWGGGAWVAQNNELAARREAEHAAARQAELAGQRVRIARDLHDVLANSIGVMVVHAEAAEEILTDDPDRAAQAMRRVQNTGRDALAEIRALLGTLRSEANQDDAATEARPAGAADRTVFSDPRHDIDHLLDSMREAGLPLRVTRHETRTLPAAAAEVIYRILQESLTNTLRHAGPVLTHIRLHVRADSATVEILDEGMAIAGSGATSGHGLAGMQERLQRFGGTLVAGPGPQQGFAVRAALPLGPPPGLGHENATQDADALQQPW